MLHQKALASETDSKPSQHNIANMALVPRKKIILSPLHKKLSLFKQFVKSFNKESPVFQFLQKNFPNQCEPKIRPQIQKLIFNNQFDKILHGNKLDAWISFKKVCKTFLGSHRSENFREVIAEILNTWCKISLKVHFLDFHLDFFYKNLGDFSDKLKEQFHQDISVINNRYKEKWSLSMLADYCCSIKRDVLETEHKRRRHYSMNKLIKISLRLGDLRHLFFCVLFNSCCF